MALTVVWESTTGLTNTCLGVATKAADSDVSGNIANPLGVTLDYAAVLSPVSGDESGWCANVNGSGGIDVTCSDASGTAGSTARIMAVRRWSAMK